MNQRTKKIERNFKPQKIGDAIKKISRNYSSKYGKIEFVIHSKWPNIAGSYFMKYSEPKNISKIVDYENKLGEVIYKNFLNVSVSPAAAVEFQHYKDVIIEKINSYFGYKAIVDLRIQQNYINNLNINQNLDMKNKNLSDNEKKYISNQVDEMENIDLKKSLLDLGKNITKGNK